MGSESGGGALDPRLPAPLPRDGRGTVATVGTFDGVHRGHRAVLTEIVERATASGRRSALVTFHPHPLTIVRPEFAPRLLTTPTEKKEILAESGIDYAVFLPFTRALSRYEPRRFVEEILVGRLDVRELVIGYDHGFGRGRSGDVSTLKQIGVELDFRVDVVPPVDLGEEPVSSSRIRAAVAEGRVEDAARGLGRPYSVLGTVVRGEGRGRTLGFPTANLAVSATDKAIPPGGIYAVWGVFGSERHPGALHIGPRPTFPGSPPSIELFLIDYDGDLYGQRIRVDFVQRLRPVVAFDSADALVDQMHQDVAEARTALADHAAQAADPGGEGSG